MKTLFTRNLLGLVVVLFFGHHCQGQISFSDAFPNISFSFPVEIQPAGDGSDRIFVVEQSGRIKVFQNSSDVTSGEVSTFLDLSSTVSFSTGQEIGLLGLAFHPNYATNGYFYVYYTDRPSNYRINIVRYTKNSDNSADPGSATFIYQYTKNQPESNHNGGKIAFGPDGFLYASIGDGGGAVDPQNNAQNLNNPFGSIIRIDVDNPANGNNYGIPAGNPRVGQSGLDELYAWGIRNTWKFSFDNTTNRIIGADVGQQDWEEINLITNGGNYGWDAYEAQSFDPYSEGGKTLVTSPHSEPIYFYDSGANGDQSITGGYVYRGTFNEIKGKYIYGDFISGRVWALDIDSSSNELLFKAEGINISSFGLDRNGEIYFSGYGTSSKIYKISGEDVDPTTQIVNGFGNWVYAGLNGANDVVQSIANSGDVYYVGGNFSQIAGVVANNIAKYSKANGWEAIGLGTNGEIYAVAVDSNDNVYVGGDFTQIDGISANNIALWNGTNWSALGQGTSGSVSEIGIDSNNRVYVGGAFTSAGSTSVNNIAYWESSSWNALIDNSSSINGTNNEIRAIAIDQNDDVYVGGNFDSAGGNVASRIAFWNGSNWNTLGDGTSGFVQSILLESDYIYIGGNFSLAGGQTANRVARWNRTNSQWESLANGVSGNVNCMALDGNFLYVGGAFETASNVNNVNEIMNNVARWSSAGGWQALGPGTNVGVSTLVNSLTLSTNNSELFVGGNFNSVGDIAATNIAVWGENVGCAQSTVTPTYTVNGNLQSGENSLTVTENSSLVLGVSESVFVTITSPDNTTTPIQLNIPIVVSVDAGIYNFITTEGCTATFELIVIDDPNGDEDNDGVINSDDLCPNTPNSEPVDINGCGESQKDDDNDGIFNNNDVCPNTPNGEDVDINGCGESQKDDDNDGVFNNQDLCPNTPNGETADALGCGPSQQDIDNDGVLNTDDLCNNTSAGETVNTDGCSDSQLDDDNDGVVNASDTCLNTPNGESVDANGCSDSQIDDDNDGVFNNVDSCPDTPLNETADASGCSDSQRDDDNDGVLNGIDQCANTPNGETVDAAGCSQSQLDDDNDGVFNNADSCPDTPSNEVADTTGCSDSQRDDDTDGVLNGADLCSNTPNGETVNDDGCSQSQLDDDNDGVFNNVDSCPNTPTNEAADASGCSISQRDDDDDGVANGEDLCPGTPANELADFNGCSSSQLDSDNDGVFDNVDICPNTPANETPDASGCSESQQDIDNDGILNSNDLCNDTPDGEAVNSDGCSESQLDDDNDGVSNAEDQCPDTEIGIVVDFEGCEITADDDGDGIANEDDICPRTPIGALVDLEGCEIFTLPSQNFQISSTGISCIGVFDGQIVIEAERSLNYIASLRGVSFAETMNFTNSLFVQDLPAGTFELCITVSNIEDYEQCFTVIVDAPQSLSVVSQFDKENRSVTLRMEGGNEYIITLNELTFTTTASEISLNLDEEQNQIKVSTGKECQGIFESTYLMTDEFLAYPNPFSERLTIARNLGSENITQLSLYTISGQLVLSKNIEAEDSQTDLNTETLPPGIYILEIIDEFEKRNLKLIKR